ncbi:Zinc finger protein CONSTANS-LIKE 3 [Gracilariopsis chorda]|uniref:Zinc finger protein CONSTANS-LIKE 3 n=1 Tax=Gracilariopsis chorda TaxID=448386 RepID=A0A2V3IE76_9FLOR|nr:Zinc finger protein CONSTANS-LIKE 3 [Gracilariopsis chorda]|eukprot:PXF40364.1 Zinc finger protein CONSTANS-LIKE 3 [Gracilariopsis chorda]
MVRNCEMCPEDHAVMATVYCAADACYLCAKCDIEVHSANRLAQRHVRSAVSACELDGSSIHDESDEGIVPDIAHIRHEESTTLTFEDAADYDFGELGLGRMPGLAGVEEIGIWGEGKLGKNWDLSWEDVVEDGFDHVVPDVESRNQKAEDVAAAVVVVKMEALVEDKKEVRIGEKRAREEERTADEEEEQKALERRKKRRKEALERFRSKRANRSFAKRVRYECRKQLADSRPRVKGRFVRKVEMALYRKYGNLYREHLHELDSGSASS